MVVILFPADLKEYEKKWYLKPKEYFLKKRKANLCQYEMYFLDGVHPNQNTRNMRVRCQKGREKAIKGNTSREQIDILK